MQFAPGQSLRVQLGAGCAGQLAYMLAGIAARTVACVCGGGRGLENAGEAVVCWFAKPRWPDALITRAVGRCLDVWANEQTQQNTQIHATKPAPPRSILLGRVQNGRQI